LDLAAAQRPVSPPAAPYLGGLVEYRGELVQFLVPERLLPPEVLAALAA
jgi:hypothetical protein